MPLPLLDSLLWILRLDDLLSMSPKEFAGSAVQQHLETYGISSQSAAIQQGLKVVERFAANVSSFLETMPNLLSQLLGEKSSSWTIGTTDGASPHEAVARLAAEVMTAQVGVARQFEADREVSELPLLFPARTKDVRKDAGNDWSRFKSHLESCTRMGIVKKGIEPVLYATAALASFLRKARVNLAGLVSTDRMLDSLSQHGKSESRPSPIAAPSAAPTQSWRERMKVVEGRILLDGVRPKLTDAQERIVIVLIEAGGGPMSNETLRNCPGIAGRPSRTLKRIPDSVFQFIDISPGLGIQINNPEAVKAARAAREKARRH